jgi:hypothetical protein
MARKNTQLNSNRPRKYFNKIDGRWKKRIGFEELKDSYPFLLTLFPNLKIIPKLAQPKNNRYVYL